MFSLNVNYYKLNQFLIRIMGKNRVQCTSFNTNFDQNKIYVSLYLQTFIDWFVSNALSAVLIIPKQTNKRTKRLDIDNIEQHNHCNITLVQKKQVRLFE